MSQHLQNGQTFPPLAIPAMGGGSLTFPDDLAGAYGVVLIYRGHWCPFCNEQLAAFSDAFDTFAQEGIKVAAFSIDDEASTAAFIEKHKIPFPMGHSAEIDAVIAATGAYDTTAPGRGRFLETTGFVLAPDGTIITAVYSSRAIGRLVPSDVLRLVAYMRSQAK